jgi:hypothetical protein
MKTDLLEGDMIHLTKRTAQNTKGGMILTKIAQDTIPRTVSVEGNIIANDMIQMKITNHAPKGTDMIQKMKTTQNEEGVTHPPMKKHPPNPNDTVTKINPACPPVTNRDFSPPQTLPKPKASFKRRNVSN